MDPVSKTSLHSHTRIIRQARFQRHNSLSSRVLPVIIIPIIKRTKGTQKGLVLPLPFPLRPFYVGVEFRGSRSQHKEAEREIFKARGLMEFEKELRDKRREKSRTFHRN